MFENRVLRKIFGPNKEVITGERRILHNEDRTCGTYGVQQRCIHGFGGET
jgi:hypothetical protein